MKTTETTSVQKPKRGKRTNRFVTITAIVALAILGVLNYPFGLGQKTDSEVLVLGHAGSGFMSPLNPFNPLPANSMGSIIKAMEKHGADGVEVDVQLSQDGVPILYHDVDLSSMTDKSGLIENHKAADVIGLKYKGGFFYELFHDEEIITLEAMLQRFATYPELPVLHLDLRNHNPERHLYYAQTLLALLKKYNYPLGKLMFISHDPAFLEAFRQVAAEAPLMLDSENEFEKDMQIAIENNFQGICANGKAVTQEQVERAKAQGLKVALFGGKSRSSISKMIALKPDAIQVNNVAAMVDLLK